MGEVRVGVVGLGYFGSFHARHYAANPRARLVAVVDADPTRAEAGAREFGTTALGDYRALIGAVDAVSVTVPTPLHHRVAADFLDAGIHVLVEKPITDDPATGRDLVARAAASGALLQVGHVERFSATFGALAKEIRWPRLIDCVRHGPWRGRAVDVDVVLDLMIHDIDLVLSLNRNPVAEISASGGALAGLLTDFAEARLVFADGAVARLSASRVSPRVDRRITVYEPEGVISADLAERRLETMSTDRGPANFTTATIPPADALGAEIAAFLASVADGAPVAVDGRAGLAALDIAARIRAAIADHRYLHPSET